MAVGSGVGVISIQLLAFLMVRNPSPCTRIIRDYFDFLGSDSWEASKLGCCSGLVRP